MRHLLNKKWLMSVIFAGLLHSNGAYAQIEEIIVTAQHREQNVQDVPVSVTALSSDQIDKAGIFDANSVAVNVPGFSYAEFAPGQSLFSLRGITSADDGAGLDNSAALFLDGVYIGRLAGINFDLFDLERIEVLKGPQGTLFGRNAIGGVISLVTQRPAQEFGARASVTAGNEGIFRYQGLLTGSITENLAGKLVVNHRQHDGFVRNTLLNIDVRDEDQTSFRGQLLFTGENSEWLLSADYMDDSREGIGRYPLVNGNFDYVGTARGLGADRPFTNASPTEGFTERENQGVSLQGDIEFGHGTLTTITGFRNVESDWEMPSVGAPLGGGFDLDAGIFGLDVIDDIEEEIDTFSQELRWTSNLDGPFNYVAGLYYFSEDTDRQEQFRIDRNTVATGQVVVGNEWTRTENETTSYAVYTQGSWDLNEQWTLTAGARYTKDNRDYRASAVNCGEIIEGTADLNEEGMPIRNTGILNHAAITGAGLPLSVCTFNGVRVRGSLGIIAESFIVNADEDWSDFSPMTSIQYRPNPTIMYFATVSTGYKAGGFAGSQGVASAARTPVDPEGVTNLEIGFKGDFLDRSLRLNATMFLMDYKDLQIVRFGPVPDSEFGTFQTTNVGQADILGLEMDFIWQVSDQFQLSGNYAWLDTETDDLVVQSSTGTDNDFSGSDLRQAPTNTYTLVGEYHLPIASGALDFRVQYIHSDENHHDYPTRKDTVTEEYDLIDARIGWTSGNERYGLSLWGKNLTDEAFSVHAYRIGPGSIGAWSDPRTIGLTGTCSF